MDAPRYGDVERDGRLQNVIDILRRIEDLTDASKTDSNIVERFGMIRELANRGRRILEDYIKDPA